jgi:hypothetical protein
VTEEKRPKKVVPVVGAEDVETDIEVAEDEAEDEVLEDTADLDGDDTIGGEIEVETDAEPEES